MINNPFETVSDSFYFINNRLIMHNKASYKYFREDAAQEKKSYEAKYGSKVNKPILSMNMENLHAHVLVFMHRAPRSVPRVARRPPRPRQGRQERRARPTWTSPRTPRPPPETPWPQNPPEPR